MNRLTTPIAFIILVAPIFLFAQQPLQMVPAKPKAGEKISLTYNSTGTELFGVQHPEAVAYLLEGTLPLAREVKLHQKGNTYRGEFNTNDSTKAVFIVFSKDEKRDNNGDKGYYTLIYTAAGEPVPGASKAMGQAYGSFGGIWGLKRDPEAALRWSREELAKNPGLQVKKPLEFTELLSASNDESDLAQIRKALQSVIDNPASKETDLTSAKFQFENKLKDKSKSPEIDSIIKKRYPSGSWVKTSIRDQVYKEKDPVKQTELFQQMQKLLDPGNEQDKRLLGSVAYSIATNFANAGEFEKAKEYAAFIPETSSRANLYNSIAWKETGGSIDGKPGNLDIAKELSAKSLDLIREMKDDIGKKPPYRTEAQFLKELDDTYTMYADTYALLLYHSKEYQQAYDIQKKAIENSKGMDISMNEAFAAYTEKIKGPDSTISILEGFVKEGRYSPKMKEQLKRLYLAQNNTIDSWNNYIAKLEAFSLEKKRQDLAKKMISESAPAFVLKDIKGNEVSLASLKGKIVVVDFWATWCGPCKASFPGMKMAVEKYKDDKDVKFVFIDTWENGEKDAVKKNVADFIEKNAYPFHVLMDMDSKTVEAFKVDGIPTKFVIDTNSKIRFRSVGFGGTAEGLASEVAMMIEMSRAGDAGTGAKKAF